MDLIDFDNQAPDAHDEKKADVVEPVFNTFTYNGKSIKTIYIAPISWICGIDIATILGYQNVKCALQYNVEKSNKKPLRQIFNDANLQIHNLYPDNNSGKSIYINEIGLKSLINNVD